MVLEFYATADKVDVIWGDELRNSPGNSIASNRLCVVVFKR